MNNYYSILLGAAPFLALLLIVEVFVLWNENKHRAVFQNLFTSAGLLAGSLLIGLVTNGLILLLFSALYTLRLFTFEGHSWLLLTVCFFGDDLSYYWYHRASHQVRFFWASHIVHHSAETFTLAGGLRVPWTSQLTGTFLFWAWLPLIGIPPYIVLFFKTTSAVYQFWLHTEYIGRLPKWFEFIFSTPAHHRIHHASDVPYLDKNHGGTLIIWDRIFGTFQPETVKPTYGLTKNIGSGNPVTIAFAEWKDIMADLRKSNKISDRLNYVFNAPGWSHDKSQCTARQLQKNFSSPQAKSVFTLKQAA